jgi:hypothetical protein
VCVEFLGDKVRAGYDALDCQDGASAAAVWLDAWSDVSTRHPEREWRLWPAAW